MKNCKASFFLMMAFVEKSIARADMPDLKFFLLST